MVHGRMSDTEPTQTMSAPSRQIVLDFPPSAFPLPPKISVVWRKFTWVDGQKQQYYPTADCNGYLALNSANDMGAELV